MRGRHVPLLCGSCQAPTSRQEDTCWRCGARVRRAQSLPLRESSTALQEGTPAAAPNGAALSYRGRTLRRRSPGHAASSRRAEDHARWQHERGDARDHAAQVELELTDAIDVGDAAYRRLRRRLDEYGTRLDAVHARLYGTPRLAQPARAGDDTYVCVATAVFANSESASVWPAPRGTTITGQDASRTRRPATPPTMTACIGP